jgi:cytochrome c-type biogenesis protein CcmH
MSDGHLTRGDGRSRGGPLLIGRRRFAELAMTAAGSILVGRQNAAGQDSARAGAADPLRRPDVVGATRRVVDSAQNDPVVVGVERRLRCTCGCGLDVFICRTTDFTCTYSPALHDEVAALLATDPDPETAVAAMVAKYGESILLAPKPVGFGILGYILPGAVIVAVGGLIVGWLARRRQPVVAPAPPSGVEPPPRRRPDGTPPPADQKARLERALQDLET